MAKPETASDGSVNLMVWQCIIPGKPSVSLLLFLSPGEIFVGQLKDWGFRDFNSEFDSLDQFPPQSGH